LKAETTIKEEEKVKKSKKPRRLLGRLNYAAQICCVLQTGECVFATFMMTLLLVNLL